MTEASPKVPRLQAVSPVSKAAVSTVATVAAEVVCTGGSCGEPHDGAIDGGNRGGSGAVFALLTIGVGPRGREAAA